MKCQQCFFSISLIQFVSVSLLPSVSIGPVLCLSLYVSHSIQIFYSVFTNLEKSIAFVLRHEWGRKWFGNWNDLKSPPTYIQDIFCFQFQMPSCATAQKTDTIWRWNVNVYCDVAVMPTAAVASAMVTAAAVTVEAASTEEIITTDCCCCCCKCEWTNKWWNCLVSLLSVLGTRAWTSKQVNIEDGKFIFP